MNPIVRAIAEAIAQMEGFYNSGDTPAKRNNNPGNLRPFRSNQETRDGFRYFHTLAEGWQALYSQIELNIRRGLTLLEFFGGKIGVYPGYAPASDSNDPVGYANFVASKTGIDPNIPLNTIGQQTGGGSNGAPNTGEGSVKACVSVSISGVVVLLLLYYLYTNGGLK